MSWRRNLTSTSVLHLALTTTAGTCSSTATGVREKEGATFATSLPAHKFQYDLFPSYFDCGEYASLLFESNDVTKSNTLDVTEEPSLEMRKRHLQLNCG